jgi:hypothetical protein
VHCDSIGAISIAQDPVKHELTKHVGVDCFYVRSTIQDKIVAFRYVLSEIQLHVQWERWVRVYSVFIVSPLFKGLFVKCPFVYLPFGPLEYNWQPFS